MAEWCCTGHVKCMGGPARRSLMSAERLWLCYSCKPCVVCLVSGRTRKLRLVRYVTDIAALTAATATSDEAATAD